MSVIRFPNTNYVANASQLTEGEETVEAHEALQAYCRSLNKLIQLLGDQVEEIKDLHERELWVSPHKKITPIS